MVVLRDTKGRFIKGTASVNKGRRMPDNVRAAIFKSRIGNSHSTETKEKISTTLKTRFSSGLKHSMLGRHHSDVSKERMRESRIRHMENTLGFNCPCIGKYEKEVLDVLEKQLKYKILRQYKIAGYFLDGYCPSLNLAIEVDEKYHKKDIQLQKDVHKECIIKDRINCDFLRIGIGGI